jgi:hypothetical protein
LHCLIFISDSGNENLGLIDTPGNTSGFVISTLFTTANCKKEGKEKKKKTLWLFCF